MELLHQYHYNKLNYQTYIQILNRILQNKELQKLGLKKTILAKSTYGYDINLLTIGTGKKELFLVGGTHGSEIISIDFLLQLINELPNLENFDPNQIKLHIIPLQNPEGFDISSNTYTKLNTEEFSKISYEYYLRYKTDYLINQSLLDLNNFIENYPLHHTSTNLLTDLKYFIKNNNNWKKLSNDNLIPNITIFYHHLEKIENITDKNDLKIKLLTICNQIISSLTTSSLSDQFLLQFITILKQNLEQTLPLNYPHNNTKLYQQMFNKTDFQGLQNKKLTNDLEHIYNKFQHPKGSHIGHDATGTGINLNANTILNPGIKAIKENKIIYGPNVKNNIRNYQPGPLGTPCLNNNNFYYTIENQILINLIHNSYSNGNYLATFLYHGTGGLIFYKPHEPMMNKKDYQTAYNYNHHLASIYSNYTNYTLLNESDTTGFGDYLRFTYPGVLLIELSKIGGNPLGPYGDKNNIYKTLNDNTKALDALFNHFNKINTITPKIKERSH